LEVCDITAINIPFATYIPVSIQKHDLTQIAIKRQFISISLIRNWIIREVLFLNLRRK